MSRRQQSRRGKPVTQTRKVMNRNPEGQYLHAAGSQIDEHVVLEAMQFAGKPARPLRADDLAAVLGGGAKAKKKILKILSELTDEGRLVFLPGGRYALPASLRQVVGSLAVQRAGMGFVSSRDPALKGRDVYISREYFGLAWNGDLVRVGLLPDNRGKNPEGVVLEVLERKQRNILAQTIRPSQSGEVLASPLDQRCINSLLVDVSHLSEPPLRGDILNTLPGDRLEGGLWRAKAVANLGNGEDVPTQEAISKLSHNIPQLFPELALEEAAALPPEPEAADFGPESGRDDLRHLDFVTIDGVSAKDFDDAIYVEKNERGFVLYVAIADVAHYVRPGSALDREAQLRGNSYYFAQSVEPMLPSALSNNLCSLKPGVNRLAVTVKMEFSGQGRLLRRPQFCFSVIRSRARLTYDTVFYALEERNQIDRTLLGALLPMLENARDLAIVLQLQRKERGALFFDLPETEALISRCGKLKDIRIAPHNFAHQMIEEFMLAANEAAADFLTTRQELFPYRVHPYPDEEKLAGLYRTLARSGLVKIAPGATDMSGAGAALPGLLAYAKKHGNEFAVSNLVLRAMMQARYSSELNIHFGLASECYCHFTSPIRRYADILVHRALRRTANRHSKIDAAAGRKPVRHVLDKVIDGANACEKQAKDAEIEFSRRLGVLYMFDRVGEEFSGRISGLTEFGIFVQLERTLIEGVIRLASLDDNFIYFPERQELLGEYSRRRFSLGLELRVRLVEAHLANLEIIFEPVVGHA